MANVMPTAAIYGRTPGMDGKVQDEWWKRKQDNDVQQGLTQNGADAANYEAGMGQTRGPTAFEDQRLSDNEASGAGGHQQGAIGLAGTLARGQQPSQAAMQLQSGLQQASAQQASMGQSARGGAAAATAGMNARANTAGLQQNAWTQGGLLRSRDMAAGRGMLGTGLGQLQAQDQQRLGLANQIGQDNAARNDSYALGMGQAAVGLGNAANAQQQTDLAWHQGGMTSVEAQSEAEQQRQRWLADAESQRIAARDEDT